MTAVVMNKIVGTAQFYGDMFGTSAVIDIAPGAKFNVRRSGGYYWVSRKSGFSLRLTDAAFSRFFKLEEQP
jgi:hypothetical protein